MSIHSMESLHQWGTVITTVVSQLQINTVSVCCGCTTADFVLPLCRYLCFISQETKIQPSETYREQFSAFSHSHYAAQSGSTSEWWIDARKVVRGKCVHWCELILKCCKKKDSCHNQKTIGFYLPSLANWIEFRSYKSFTLRSGRCSLCF